MKVKYKEHFRQVCDICHTICDKVYYDMPYIAGHWANLCEGCRQNADNPDNPAGVKIVKGRHPNADPPKEKPKGIEQANTRQAKEKAYVDSLSMEELEGMVFDGVVEVADGCEVEPDGHCPHGYSSPLLIKGLI